MSPRDLVYVGHMLDMARKAVTKTTGLSREVYDADENLRLALIYLVQVIGEAARHVSRNFNAAHPEIPWENIIGMRHDWPATFMAPARHGPHQIEGRTERVPGARLISSPARSSAGSRRSGS